MIEDFRFSRKQTTDYLDKHLCPNCLQTSLESKYNTTVDMGRTKEFYKECSYCGLVFKKVFKFINLEFDGWIKMEGLKNGKQRVNDSDKDRDPGTSRKNSKRNNGDSNPAPISKKVGTKRSVRNSNGNRTKPNTKKTKRKTKKKI